MAGQVPMTRPPGYGAQLGDTLMAGSAARGEAVGAELDARAKALSAILGNIKGIAEVGGGMQAPDRLIDQFAGGDVPVFGGEYAGMADRLRLATMARTASGGGGGGGGGSGGNEEGNVVFRDAQGNIVLTRDVKDTDLDEVQRKWAEQTPGGSVEFVLDTPIAAPAGGGGGGGATTGPRDNGDGTWTLSNGTRVDANGAPVP